MLTYFEIVSIVGCSASAFFCIKNFKKSVSNIVGLILYFLCVVPLILDFLFGYPVYSISYPGFSDSAFDDYTRLIYSFFILMLMVIMAVAGNNKRIIEPKNTDYFSSEKFTTFLLILSFLAPFLAFSFGMKIKYIFTWAWRYDGIDTSTINGYGTLERISYICVIASCITFFRKKRLSLKILSLSSLYVNVCIEGKRSALFFGIISLLICYLFLAKKSNRLLVWASVAAFSTIVIGVSISIQSNFRGYETFEETYRILRVDFFRDDVIKASIYSILYPSKMRILNYPFQSLLMQIGYLFPIVWLDVPKIGYETFMTAALKYTTPDFLINDVRMTVSFIDAFISNFGFFGMLLVPLFCVFFSRTVDNKPSTLKPIFLCGFVLYSMYSLSYVCWYFEFWIIALVWLKFIKNKYHHSSIKSAFSS